MTFFAWLNRTLRHKARHLTKFQYGLYSILFLWGTYFTWLWIHVFRRDTEGNILAGHALLWADWSAHITYASVFAYRDPSDWFVSHPLYSQAKFSYPFVPDALSGLLMRMGVDIIPAFIIPSIVVTLLFLYVLFRFMVHFTHRVKAAFIAVCLFFFSGGLGFLYAIQTDGSQYNWYTHIPEHGVYFINFIVGEMLPQRTFLFGLPIALAIILLLEHIISAKRKSILAPSVIAGLLAGSLTVIHPHSLIVVFVVSSFYLLQYRHLFRRFLIYAATAGLIVSLFWLLFLVGSNTGSAPHLQLGWMANESNMLIFELLNFGILLPLGIYAAAKQRLLTHPLFMSGIFLFVACHFVSFQAWEWDNTKLFTYAYLFLLIPIAKYIVFLWEDHHRKIINKSSVLFLCVLLSLSGVIDVIRLSQIDTHTFTLISKSDEEAVARFRQLAPSGSILIANPNSDQPYTMLGNTQALMSYQGWLWSYGIDFENTQQVISSILNGESTALQLLNQYNIAYIVVDKNTRQSYQVNDIFLQRFPVVQSINDTKIYKTSP